MLKRRARRAWRPGQWREAVESGINTVQKRRKLPQLSARTLATVDNCFLGLWGRHSLSLWLFFMHLPCSKGMTLHSQDNLPVQTISKLSSTYDLHPPPLPCTGSRDSGVGVQLYKNSTASSCHTLCNREECTSITLGFFLPWKQCPGFSLLTGDCDVSDWQVWKE